MRIPVLDDNIQLSVDNAVIRDIFIGAMLRKATAKFSIKEGDERVYFNYTTKEIFTWNRFSRYETQVVHKEATAWAKTQIEVIDSLLEESE